MARDVDVGNKSGRINTADQYNRLNISQVIRPECCGVNALNHFLGSGGT
jgi:hypothetical protein